MFKLDAPGPGGSPPDLDESLPPVDLPLIMPDDEFRAPAPKPPPAPAPPPPPPAPPPPRSPPSPPAAVVISDDDGAADTATLSQAEPVLTETMAELYLKQGHHQDGLRVYQALLTQRPNDTKLRSRVEQWSGGGGKKRSGVAAQAVLKEVWGRAIGGGPTTASDEPQSTLAAAFDVAGPPPGEPSHPATDHISLDSVFGEGAARRASAPSADAAAEAGTSGAAAPAASDGSKTGGFSFDEFFAGGKPGADAPAGETAPPKTPGASRTSGRTQRPPEDEAEADQFQQWLKKLKS